MKDKIRIFTLLLVLILMMSFLGATLGYSLAEAKAVTEQVELNADYNSYSLEIFGED